MKNYEFWCTKKCPGKEFKSEFIYEYMENHEFMYDFMKKTYDFQEVSRPRILIYEFIYEFMFTHVNSYIISYMKTFFMNSYVNSYMNYYM